MPSSPGQKQRFRSKKDTVFFVAVFKLSCCNVNLMIFMYVDMNENVCKLGGILSFFMLCCNIHLTCKPSIRNTSCTIGIPYCSFTGLLRSQLDVNYLLFAITHDLLILSATNDRVFKIFTRKTSVYKKM